MKRFLAYFFSITASVALIYAMLFSSVEMVIFDTDFYESEYLMLSVAQNIGMSQADLMGSTHKLLGYVKGDEKDLKISAKIDGKKREVFNKREKEHMIDVAALYKNFNLAKNAALIYCALGAVVVFLLLRKDFLIVLSKGFSFAAILAVVFIAALAGWILIDFNSFWTAFHQVLFTNDLWQLDPRTSVMINMYPSQFFFDMCLKIVGIFAVAFGGLTIASVVYNFIRAKKRNSILKISDGEGDE